MPKPKPTRQPSFTEVSLAPLWSPTHLTHAPTEILQDEIAMLESHLLVWQEREPIGLARDTLAIRKTLALLEEELASRHEKGE